MRAEDREKFAKILMGAAEYYGKEVSGFTADVFWKALEKYPVSQVSSAFTKHISDPESGRFMPKVADIVKWCDGTADDVALAAWSKVHNAIIRVGQYQKLAFDDPAIHATIQAMGGWIRLAETETDQMPWSAKEFASHYKRLRDNPGDYPAVINGPPGGNVIAIGNPEKVNEVVNGGAKALPDRRILSLTAWEG